jgi:hypothetical protein
VAATQRVGRGDEADGAVKAPVVVVIDKLGDNFSGLFD